MTLVRLKLPSMFYPLRGPLHWHKRNRRSDGVCSCHRRNSRVSPKERVYWIIIDFKHKPVSRLSMFSTGNTPIIGSFLTGGDHFDEFRDEDSIKTTRLNGFFGDRSSPWTISARG